MRSRLQYRDELRTYGRHIERSRYGLLKGLAGLGAVAGFVTGLLLARSLPYAAVLCQVGGAAAGGAIGLLAFALYRPSVPRIPQNDSTPNATESFLADLEKSD